MPRAVGKRRTNATSVFDTLRALGVASHDVLLREVLPLRSYCTSDSSSSASAKKLAGVLCVADEKSEKMLKGPERRVPSQVGKPRRIRSKRPAGMKMKNCGRC